MAARDEDEGSSGGRRTLMLFGVVATLLTVLGILIGTGHITGSKVASEAPPPNAETPAPQPSTETPAKTNP